MQAAEFRQESIARPPLPSASPLSNSNAQQKQAHFDPAILDNEWKVKARNKKSIRVASAKTCRRLGPPSYKSSAAFQPSRLLGQYSDLEQSQNPNQRHPTLSPQTLVQISTQRPIVPSQIRLNRMMSAQSPLQRQASSSSTRETSFRITESAHVPLGAPNTPSHPGQRIPPTPSPARLPTPDLVEIDVEAANVYMASSWK
ncbi:hypothetical protein B2J93_364 [Marssonina coronariae]|uniref:Uncharacterized protein n=1 Tax=Diplocarpon coronariae TaxID=2795749 RepID=A0A218ZA52_9HELO|nr:hypothetical protein JHW43_006101 [Diplocarpon mali]OWP04155.1 hypothetical protein B2J93_364 [Marssonina coronariae]